MGLTDQEKQHIGRVANRDVKQAADKIAAAQAIASLPPGQRMQLQALNFICQRLASIERLTLALVSQGQRRENEGAEPETPKES